MRDARSASVPPPKSSACQQSVAHISARNERVMLHLDGLVVQYGRAVAVQELSLEVREGELVGLVGPNGAGKSTTLSAIMGFLRPTAGAVRLHGSDVTGAPPQAIARMRVALVPEGRQLFATMTVGENLRLGATVRRDRAAVDADLDGLLD